MIKNVLQVECYHRLLYEIISFGQFKIGIISLNAKHRQKKNNWVDRLDSGE